ATGIAGELDGIDAGRAGTRSDFDRGLRGARPTPGAPIACDAAVRARQPATQGARYAVRVGVAVDRSPGAVGLRPEYEAGKRVLGTRTPIVAASAERHHAHDTR